MSGAVVPPPERGPRELAVSLHAKSRTTARNRVSQQWATRAETSSSRTNFRATSAPLQELERRQQPRTPDNGTQEKKSAVSGLGNKVHQFWLSIPAAKQQQNKPHLRISNVEIVDGSSRNCSEHIIPVVDVSPHGNGNNDSCSRNHTNGEDNHKYGSSTDRLTAFPVRNKSHDQNLARPTAPTKVLPTPLEKRAQLADTLTDIKITSHLHSHIETITNSHSSHYLKSVLRILPRGFDETSACTSSVQTRKRAFFLLDLARVIRNHALFLNATRGFGGTDIFVGGSAGSGGDSGGGGRCIIGKKKEVNKETTIEKGVYIRPQFQVTKNPNLELLKLLIRLGVTLRCNSSDDVLVASRALMEERKERNHLTTTVGNNDLQDHSKEEEIDAISSCCRNTDDDNVDNDTQHQQQGRDLDRNSGDIHQCDVEEDVEEDVVFVDDVTNVRKPDGYFRRLLRARRIAMSPGIMRPRMSRHRSLRDRYLEVAVDGVDEVRRISNTVHRISSRCLARSFPEGEDGAGDCHDRGSRDMFSSLEHIRNERCRFILRLPVTTMAYDTAENLRLENLVLSAHDAATREGSDLGGASIDLSEWSRMLECNYIADQAKGDEAYSCLTKLCTCLRRVRLALLSVNQYRIRIDLTGLPDTFISLHAAMLTRALTSIVSCDVTCSELAQIHDKLRTGNFRNDTLIHPLAEICRLANATSSSDIIYTADVSELLVARAGALCARIIGVKNQSDKLNATATTAEQHLIDESNGTGENEEKHNKTDGVLMHYYIDDGCYGSLGSSKCSAGSSSSSSSCDTVLENTPSGTIAVSREHLPEPLYGNKPLKRSPSHLALKEKSPRQIQMQNKSHYVRATVWGPTCDGLDRVCASVLLPNDLVANRDWLMFRNLGCGGFGGGLGLGTAFNGFDPPDVDYCALPRSTN